MAQTYVPTIRQRTSTVTNGGTTTQDIYNEKTELMLADIGASVSFVVQLPTKSPIPIPPTYPQNPHTT